jgi:putative membrane protein
MRKATFIIMSASVLVLTACGKKHEAAAPPADVIVNDEMATALPAPAVSPDQAFANAAAASDAFEVESSKLALKTSSSSAIKAFATKMIAAHTESTAKLKTTAAALSPAITPDATLSADQQRMLDSLKMATGEAFDADYAADQVDAHQKALDALKAYAATGAVPELKGIANTLIPKVTAHLNMAKALKP